MLGLAPLGRLPLGASGAIIATVSTIVETRTAADALSGAIVASQSVDETSIYLVPTFVPGVGYVNLVAGDATDYPAATMFALGARAEAGSAVDAASNSGVLVATIVQAGAAVDVVTNFGVLLAVRPETGTASDAAAALNLAAAAAAEAGSASDQPANVLQAISARAETGSAADVPTDVAVLVSAIGETGAAVDVASAPSFLVGTRAESGSVADVTDAAAARYTVGAESLASSDASSNLGTLVAEMREPTPGAAGFGLGTAPLGSSPLGVGGVRSGAVDTVTDTAIMVPTRVEPAAAADTPVGTLNTAVQTVSETRAASDAATVYKGVLVENRGNAQDAIQVGVLSTGPFSTAVAALLRGDTVNICYGVRFDFLSGPVAVWQGIGPLDATLYGAPVFQGIGNFGKIGSIELGTVAATQAVTFDLSGLDATFYASAQSEATEVRGRRCSLYVLVFAVDGTLIEVRKRRTFLMDKIVKKLSADADPPTFSLSLSCEPILSSKNKAPLAFLTDADQRARYPGDKALERMQILTNHQTIVWN